MLTVYVRKQMRVRCRMNMCVKATQKQRVSCFFVEPEMRRMHRRSVSGVWENANDVLRVLSCVSLVSTHTLIPAQ